MATTKKHTKKASTKKAAPKKAAVKKSSSKKFAWTDDLKEKAKAELLVKYNAAETEKLKTLRSVHYTPDGVAKTGGKKGFYTVNMK